LYLEHGPIGKGQDKKFVHAIHNPAIGRDRGRLSSVVFGRSDHSPPAPGASHFERAGRLSLKKGDRELHGPCGWRGLERGLQSAQGQDSLCAGHPLSIGVRGLGDEEIFLHSEASG
jgi:hypothetical protein